MKRNVKLPKNESKKSAALEKAREKYSKPKVIAKNAPSGGYAAGCPERDSYMCKTCFRN